jgi:hypothetical protein
MRNNLFITRSFRATLFIGIFLLLGAPSIYFNIMIPAAVNMPPNIESIAIIDRSHSENEVVNVLEKGLMSAISGKADRLSKHCIDGVFDQLEAQNRYSPVITGIVEKRKGSAIDFPEPMHWIEVDRICREHRVDALLSLEIFSRQYVSNAAEVKVGFRLYDPSSRLIIDEYQFFHGIGKNRPPSEGDPGLLVLNALNDDDAMKQAGYIAGTIYGKRVSPFWIRAKRDYYKRSKRDPKMAEGARMMEVNNWDAAIAAFQLAIEHGHRKTKGRASHNLAIVYEILGDLDLAYATAGDAWGKYRNKASKDYSAILQQRIHERNMLVQK